MSSGLTLWQESKFKSLFDLFDTNGNGMTDESELEGAMERLQLDTGWPEHSRVLSHVSARWKVLVQDLFADSPILTSQKWLEYLRRFLQKDLASRADRPEHRGRLEELGQLLFSILDRDRDSKVDYHEFLVFFYALGLKDSHAEESFEKLDCDQNGFLSKADMESLTRDYFHGREPAGPADWLFGPPPEA